MSLILRLALQQTIHWLSGLLLPRTRSTTFWSDGKAKYERSKGEQPWLGAPVERLEQGYPVFCSLFEWGNLALCGT